MEDNANRLYHYCDFMSFKSIVENKLLWLSDVEKSNDYEERVWAKREIMARLSMLLESKYGAAVSKKVMKSLGVMHKEVVFPENKVYCCCFSEGVDLLSQWRGYGKDGRGFAIGFDKKMLGTFVNGSDYAKVSRNFAFAKINYNLKKFDDYVNRTANHIMKNYENGYTSFRIFIHEFENNAIKLCLHKKTGFREEKEWRLCFNSPVKSVYHSHDLDVDGNGSLIISTPKVRYRWRNEISYFELNFEGIKDSLVKEVIIGPKAKHKVNSIHDVLISAGYKQVNVIRSTLSYR